MVLASPTKNKQIEKPKPPVEKVAIPRPEPKKDLIKKTIGHNKPEPRVEPEKVDLAKVEKVIDEISEQTSNNIEDVAITPPNIDDASQLNNIPPSYPRLSKRRREEGLVILELLVLEDGSVAEIIVETSSGFPRLDKAALIAVSKWRYTPATRHGETIAYRYKQPIEFAMK
jgi:protein TonB